MLEAESIDHEIHAAARHRPGSPTSCTIARILLSESMFGGGPLHMLDGVRREIHRRDLGTLPSKIKAVAPLAAADISGIAQRKSQTASTRSTAHTTAPDGVSRIEDGMPPFAYSAAHRSASPLSVMIDPWADCCELFLLVRHRCYGRQRLKKSLARDGGPAAD